MLNVAGGLVDVTGGVVTVEGADPAAQTRREKAALRRRQIGVVFQDLNLLPTSRRPRTSACRSGSTGSVADAQAMALDALVDVELEGLGNRFPDELGGGQRQRVAVARGFVGQRLMLLADEPTGAPTKSRRSP